MLLLLSVWCGLVAGLLEVATIVVRKHSVDPNHLYGMSRHFVWLIPIINAAVFTLFSVTGSLLGLVNRRAGAWVATRGMGALILLPPLLVALPRVYSWALAILAVGAASRFVPLITRHRIGFKRMVAWSFPVVVGVVLFLQGSIWWGERSQRIRAAAQPVPPASASSVLLVVMDSVAAGHTSVSGYARPTSRTLAELAERGITFTHAQAASSWTLPSHASMFTGKWPHDLAAGWLTPLDKADRTLAELLSSRGYATAGFVANTQYCALDSGLGRGFASYEDFVFPNLTACKMAVLIGRLTAGAQFMVDFGDEWWDLGPLRGEIKKALRLLDADRKDAVVVNQQLLDWLAQHRPAKRPFFAFLNYFDAHFPYQLPPGRIRRFGTNPTADRDREMIQRWWEIDKTAVSTRDVTLALDAYDDCVADLDEQIGCLFDELKRRGFLERTWVIIVADHGESFGEHAGIFCHGTSLYQTELHVPLVIIPPGATPSKRVISNRVSLRDLAATIVDLAGQQDGSPIPGESLARFWRERSAEQAAASAGAQEALSEVVPADPVDHDLTSRRSQAVWPLAALADQDWSYIRREGDVREELYDLRHDAGQEHNLAPTPAVQATLARMRAAMGQLTNGPLTPERFVP
jgi:arylsulfatase A-like enzyme